MDLILSIDQSTTATKAILFDSQGRLLHRFNQPHQQYYPQPGWVEHDPEEIWQNTLAAIAGVCQTAGLADGDIARQVRVLTIANQRETIMIWERETGRPIHRAITWQCNRAASICQAISDRGLAPLIKERSGLVLSPYFSAAKAAWLLEHVPGARGQAEDGKLMLGTMDCWLTWKLTGGAVHATDFSNASRTQLFNIFEKRWDEKLLDIFGIPASLLPRVRCSDEVFGHVVAGQDPRQANLAGLPVAGIMGDSHAALFGQNCFEQGMAKATYGTGSSIMMNIGLKARQSDSGLVTSIAWGRNQQIEYVFEGNINCTGATIKWLVDDLQLIASAKESAEWAASVPDNGGVYLAPAFVGLGAPYWDSEARASITGMTRATRKAHIVRAAEESIAYQIKDIVDLMRKDSGLQMPELRVDGGPTRDDFLMQFQADILDIPIACARIEELSALGSCLMGGLAVGVWPDIEAIRVLREPGRVYSPDMDQKNREQLYDGWREAVRRTLSRR
ncbi:MAG: glycerol kinase GlpK [Bacillota bacterium]|nr:glycerol kinase GlpK [Bacillota bacterium]